MYALAALDHPPVALGASFPLAPQAGSRVPRALDTVRAAARERPIPHRAALVRAPLATASVHLRNAASSSTLTASASATVIRICAIEGLELWLGRLCDDGDELPILRTPLAPVVADGDSAADLTFFESARPDNRGESSRPTTASAPQLDEVLADATVRHLACSLGPALRAPGDADARFVRLAVAAMQARIAALPALAQRSARRRGGLAAWQERRARELLLAGVDRQVPLRELAAACRLSVSHFVRAFRQSTGLSPHRWIVERRIEMSKDLLSAGKERSLADIALLCGFSDQSHFTRSFARAAGMTPGAWRRFHMGAVA